MTDFVGQQKRTEALRFGYEIAAKLRDAFHWTEKEVHFFASEIAHNLLYNPLEEKTYVIPGANGSPKVSITGDADVMALLQAGHDAMTEAKVVKAAEKVLIGRILAAIDEFRAAPKKSRSVYILNSMTPAMTVAQFRTLKRFIESFQFGSVPTKVVR